MFKLSSIVLLVFSIYYIQCLPAQSSESVTKAETGNKVHLYVNNGTEGTNYHLSTVFQDLEKEDQVIDAELTAILPYLNFLFNSNNGADGLDGCFDQLEVQLVHA